MPMTSAPLFLYGLTQLKMGSYWSKTSMLEKSRKEAKSFAWPPVREKKFDFCNVNWLPGLKVHD